MNTDDTLEVQRLRKELEQAEIDLGAAIDLRCRLMREVDHAGRQIRVADDKVFDLMRKLYELGFYDLDPQAKP